MATGTAIAVGMLACVIPVCLYLLWRALQQRQHDLERRYEADAIDARLESERREILDRDKAPEEVVREWDRNRSR